MQELSAKVADPYAVVLRTRKLPMGLLTDPTKAAKMNLLVCFYFIETNMYSKRIHK